MTLVLGLTGGICSGKSTVCQIFAKNQIPIIDADSIAKSLVAPGSPQLKKIAEHFGQDILNDGELDRLKLRGIIFSDPNEKAWLESLLHPLVYRDIQQRIKQCTGPLCLVDIPLLAEAKQSYDDLLDEIIVVDCDKDTQIARLRERDKCSEVEARRIIDSQASREHRLAMANQILDNSKDIQSLEHETQQLIAHYRALAKQP